MRKLSTMLASLILLVASLLALSGSASAQSGPSCFYERANGDVQRLPICENGALNESDFKTDGLPNPLTGCYLWTQDISKPGTPIDCNDERVFNAQQFNGGGGGETPESPTIESAAEKAKLVQAEVPNCYNTSSEGGYKRVECSEAGLFAYYTTTGKGFENGECYLLGGTPTGGPTAREISCSTVQNTVDNARAVANGTDRNGEAFIETECTASNNYESCGLVGFVYQVVNFLSVGVGLVIIASVIIGGLQYMTAGNNPQAVTKAKTRVFNAIIALVIYMFLFTFLQWLIPGGLFGA